jgi:hypothetical protein
VPFLFSIVIIVIFSFGINNQVAIVSQEPFIILPG